jgi:itaconate CoA-transferase
MNIPPLQGVTVISLEQAIAAPFATRQLAELGARVIKVERPGSGDFARHYDRTVHGLSSHFVWVNRSKESLTLNLKTSAGQKILEQLISRADVFVHNLAPGAVDRLGFSADRLRKAYPGLIVCQISGYGNTGPYRDKKAYDLLVQAETGVLSITGTEETPSKAGIPVADIAAGMYAFTGILSGIIGRLRTGAGATINVSLFEALAEWMGYPLYYTKYGGSPPPRTGASHAAIAPYGPFPTGDGKQILFAIQNEREWRRFCEAVLQRPELAEDPRFTDNDHRVRNRHSLHETIRQAFRELTLEEVARRLDDAQIANAHMRTVQEFAEHPQLRALNRWRAVETEAGPIDVLLPPLTVQNMTAPVGPVPALGEHTEAILRELGYETGDLESLRQDGVI